MTDISGWQQPLPESGVLPDCMMPDGAEPCAAYQRLQQERDDYRADYIRVHHDKCDVLDFLIEKKLWHEYKTRSKPAATTIRQDTAEVTDETKQHSSVRADDHEVGQPSPEDVERAREISECDNARRGTCFAWFDRGELCAKCNKIAAALSAARAEGEREGLERAAQAIAEH